MRIELVHRMALVYYARSGAADDTLDVSVGPLGRGWMVKITDDHDVLRQTEAPTVDEALEDMAMSFVRPAVHAEMGP